MTFETSRDVLNWYEKQPRSLTPEFINTIQWDEVRRHPLDKKFIPVLVYMRDVEVLTEMYHDQMKRTPTGKEPSISKFMERWGVEEITHGELINRFLNEAGIETGKDWIDETKRQVPESYTRQMKVILTLTNFVGRRFIGAHMAYGAVNEFTALQSYRRLAELANHPVLTYILRGIMREESVHSTFYQNVAKLELNRSIISRKLARFVLKHFFVPVGQGAKLEKDTNYMGKTLFGDEEGLELIDKHVTKRMQELPGFQGLQSVTQKIAKSALAGS